MRINSIKFEDKSRGWKLDEMRLNKLTLLVGASGVGKTQILKAFMALKSIGQGDAKNGISWVLDFDTNAGDNYVWEGEFEAQATSIQYEEDYFFVKELGGELNKIEETRKVVMERLTRNGKEIVNRDAERILFDGRETLKLSQNQSVVHLLKLEHLVKPVYASLNEMLFSDQSASGVGLNRHGINLFYLDFLNSQYDSLPKIQESGLDMVSKLFFISRVDRKVFNIIKQRFIAIFPQVTDLKIDPIDIRDNKIPESYKDYPFIQIRESGVDKWIHQYSISSGMYRTLMHLGEIYLCAEGSVFLIDEFENSLGINCIEEMTNDILNSKRKLQFILTSHHPYIINNIHFDNWKLVTRKGGVVKAHNASEFNLGHSKHDAFMQLLQLEVFQTGIEQ